MKKTTGIIITALLTMIFSVQAFAGPTPEDKLAAQNEAMKYTLVQAKSKNDAVKASTMEAELNQAAIAQNAKNQALADAAALQTAQAALAAQMKIAATPSGKTPEQAAVVDAAQKAVVSLTIKAAKSADNAIKQEQLLGAVAIQTAEKQMAASQELENAIVMQSAITGQTAINSYNEIAVRTAKQDNAPNVAALNQARAIINH